MRFYAIPVEKFILYCDIGTHGTCNFHLFCSQRSCHDCEIYKYKGSWEEHIPSIFVQGGVCLPLLSERKL